MAFLLGIDIGTSTTKAILCDDTGTILGAATSDYPLHQPHAGWSEQDPQDWWHAVVETIRALVAQHPGITISAIGLSGQMHGSVLLGSDASSGGTSPVLRRALLWNDQRTGPQCDRIRTIAGFAAAFVADEQAVLAVTGVPQGVQWHPGC